MWTPPWEGNPATDVERQFQGDVPVSQVSESEVCSRLRFAALDEVGHKCFP
jgi:hypothetical protein